MDLQKICRLCSLTLHKPKDIFTTPYLLNKIYKFTDIQITHGDGLPCSICDLCEIKLQIADKFRQQVGKADKLIRALVLKQAADLNESQRSAFEKRTPTPRQNNVSQSFENGFRPQASRRSEICRERMRLSEGRPRQKKLFQRVKLRRKNLERSLIYSAATARSLVASYKALISRCRSRGFIEEFSLPSSFIFSDNESDEGNADERAAARFAAARRHLREKRITKNHFTDRKILKNVTRTVTNQNLPNATTSRVPADPLNLLKVKSVHPLVDEDISSSSDNFTVDLTSRTVSWRRDCQRGKAPGYQESTEDLEDFSSTECVSTNTNFSEKYRRSGSSDSSKSILKINEQRLPRRDCTVSSSINVSDAKASGNQKSAAQCPICDKILKSEKGLKIHFWVHRSIKCPICEYPTETRDEFKNHMQSHVIRIEANSLFKCGLCTSIFKTNIGLNMHMRLHSKSVPVVKNCPHCLRKFASLRGFRIHRAKAHKGYETE